MSSRVEAFEHWIRTSFVQMNTELENLYFAQADRAQVIGCGEPIKASLRDEGHVHVVALLAEGNTGDGLASASGVHPFIVGLIAVIACNGFFLPYQSTTYLALYAGTAGKLFTHLQATPAALADGIWTIIAVALSVPVWRLLGLL